MKFGGNSLNQRRNSNSRRNSLKICLCYLCWCWCWRLVIPDLKVHKSPFNTWFVLSNSRMDLYKPKLQTLTTKRNKQWTKYSTYSTLFESTTTDTNIKHFFQNEQQFFALSPWCPKTHEHRLTFLPVGGVQDTQHTVSHCLGVHGGGGVKRDFHKIDTKACDVFTCFAD